MRFCLSTAGLRGLAHLAVCVGMLTAICPAAEADSPSKGSDREAKYTVKETDGGKAIFRNGEKVAEYLTRSGNKPVIWPLMGPDGVEMTRRYPMADAGPQEREDHVHHRSFWLTHGEVNGIDFWAETEGAGTIEHREFTDVEEGATARLETKNDWVDADGKRVLSDERTFIFGDDGEHRVVDVDVTLRATAGPVQFGDTKEGSFGLRLAGTMKMDAEPGGEIVTSRGVTGGDAWGKKAEWVDYVGPINDKTYGVTIMNHPSSFGFPCRWHVRTYGLFAANPFGVYHFEGGEPTDGVRLAEGESLRLRYRVLLHRGTTEEAKVADAWKRYKATK